MSEKEVENAIRLHWTQKNKGRLFRNVSSSAWVGRVLRPRPGEVTLINPRQIKCGLVKGAADLIGWTEAVIKPEDVGKKMAVFTAIEAKSRTGRLSPQQKRFLDVVNSAGGIGMVLREGDDLDNL